MNQKIVIVSLVGVALNVILALLVETLATEQEKNPASVEVEGRPGKASDLSFKGQVVHMLVDHKKVLLSSSVIIFAVVFLAQVLAKQLNLVKMLS